MSLRNTFRYRARSTALLPLFFCVLLLAASGFAKDDANDTCLACHGDKAMTTKRAGRTVSLYVDNKHFGASVHGSLNCTSCHVDLEGKDLPHEKPKRVNCGTCHETEAAQHAKSLHGKAIARG